MSENKRVADFTEDGIEKMRTFVHLLPEPGGEVVLACLDEIERLKRKVNYAFADGAKWWEYQREGATMWPADQDRAWVEAEKRYNERPGAEDET